MLCVIMLKTKKMNKDLLIGLGAIILASIPMAYILMTVFGGS